MDGCAFQNILTKIPDWSSAVVQVPPGFWWVQISAPQFPVIALS